MTWEIRTHVVTEDEAEREALAAQITGGIPTPAGEYRLLVHDGEVWMSDVPSEIADHAEVLEQAARRGGRVLVHGLGLGLVINDLLTLDRVEHVDVVELEPEIIRLTGVQFAGLDRVSIRWGNALTFEWPDDAWWSVVWHDIWADTGTETWEEAFALTARFAGRCDWQACWAHPM